MPMQRLSLETLARLDEGRFGARVNELLAEIVRDLENRSSFKKPRKLSLALTFTPIGNGDSFAVTGECAHVLPKTTSPMPTVMKPVGGRDGTTLTWKDDSADDPEQQTFNDLREQK